MYVIYGHAKKNDECIYVTTGKGFLRLSKAEDNLTRLYYNVLDMCEKDAKEKGSTFEDLYNAELLIIDDIPYPFGHFIVEAKDKTYKVRYDIEKLKFI